MKKFINLFLFSLLLLAAQDGVAQARDKAFTINGDSHYDLTLPFQYTKDALPLFHKVAEVAPTAQSYFGSKSEETGQAAMQDNSDVMMLGLAIALFLIFSGLSCSAKGRIVVFANYTDLTMSLMAFILPVLIAIFWVKVLHKGLESAQFNVMVEDVFIKSFALLNLLSFITGVLVNWRCRKGALGCILGPITKILTTCCFFLIVFKIFSMFDEAKSKKTSLERNIGVIIAFFWAILLAKFISWLIKISVASRCWGSLSDWLTGNFTFSPVDGEQFTMKDLADEHQRHMDKLNSFTEPKPRSYSNLAAEPLNSSLPAQMTQNNDRSSQPAVLSPETPDNKRLINCPDCGKDISARALSCPNCGCPMLKQLEPNTPQAEQDPKSIKCPKCGSALISENGVCINCGQKAETNQISSGLGCLIIIVAAIVIFYVVGAVVLR
ncbi:zinc ribbon domain-containing protein [Deltaproteobacteria bacterium OttesenSCG-928-M10]|nr:zinc ribbon domain-containing protein [Deltaproteobacteria bacterium OttesenSCG-928-M10]